MKLCLDCNALLHEGNILLHEGLGRQKAVLLSYTANDIATALEQGFNGVAVNFSNVVMASVYYKSAKTI